MDRTAMGPLVTFVYTLLWACALPLMQAHRRLRGALTQRLGLYPVAPVAPTTSVRLWMHGASAGDVLALVPTARALRARLPRCTLILTTMTHSGLAMARQQGFVFDQCYLSPADVPFVVRRALNRLQPSALVLEYTELWPALIAAAHAKGVPVALHNGRFAAQGLSRYRLLFAVVGPILPKLAACLMRDEQEAARARALGAPGAIVHITGNTKFDTVRAAPAPQKVQDLRAWMALAANAPLLVCGSTHEGEEQHLIATYKRLKEKLPALRLVLAPRYIERAQKLVSLCALQDLTASRRTSWGPAPEHAVMILDTVGELAASYALASVAFVGGSFVARGGQNILEPAALGKPVVFGPNMKNFSDAVAVLLGRGGVQVHSFEHLHNVLAQLLANLGEAEKLGRTAEAQVRATHGAADRNALCLIRMMQAKTPGRRVVLGPHKDLA